MPRPEVRRIFPAERLGQTLLVSPRGDALGVEESHLRREIDALHQRLEEGDLRGLVFDVGGAPYFSSIVIGAVMAMAEKVRSSGGRCAFCNASAGMRDILSIMKIDSVLPYFATRDEALRAVGDGEDAAAHSPA